MITCLKKYKPEILGATVCLALGMAVGYFTHGGKDAWYRALNHPSFTPPSWVFAPVWTILYLLMGVAFGKIWKQRDHQPRLLWLFFIQFALNLLWSPLFFSLHSIGLAFVDILLLWGMLFSILLCVRKDAFLLSCFLPYFLWVSFATVLNGAYFDKNGGICLCSLGGFVT